MERDQPAKSAWRRVRRASSGRLTARGLRRPVRAHLVSNYPVQFFCFNLLRLCNPIAKPEGAELRQTLETFIEQDDRLTEWTVNDFKRKMLARMQKAEMEHGSAFGELRSLLTLQRLPAVRAMVNNRPNFAFRDFLVKFKPCWMMSPTSLANLVDLSIFDGTRASS